jgi:hypothetical protein
MAGSGLFESIYIENGRMEKKIRSMLEAEK